MLGCNLYKLIKAYHFKGLPVPLIKMIAKQLLIGLSSLHRNQVGRGDWFRKLILLPSFLTD
jgi:hypothetical protein